MKDGQIAEQGSHAQLMCRERDYASLFNSMQHEVRPGAHVDPGQLFLVRHLCPQCTKTLNNTSWIIHKARKATPVAGNVNANMAFHYLCVHWFTGERLKTLSAISHLKWLAVCCSCCWDLLRWHVLNLTSFPLCFCLLESGEREFKKQTGRCSKAWQCGRCVQGRAEGWKQERRWETLTLVMLHM